MKSATPSKSSQRKLPAWLFSLSLAALGCATPLRAEPDVLPSMGGMVSPEIDVDGKPFSYFRNSSDILGTYLSPVASQVTPEGYIYNGFGDLMFFLGNPPVPVNQRIRTLRDGTLPIIEYTIEEGGVLYTFTMFASDLGGKMTRLPVNFVRIQARNVSAEPRTAFVSSAYRFSPPTLDFQGELEYRFLQNMGALPEKFTAGQTAFDPAWKYSLAGDALLRDGRALYVFPQEPRPYQKSLSIGRRAQSGVKFLSGQIEMGKVEQESAKPEIPLGLVTYRLDLAPGESKAVDFKYPVVPLPDDSEEIAQVRAAAFDGELERVIRFWETKVASKIPLSFPEEKVQQALVANSCYMLLSVNQVGNTIVPVCNKFQYNSHPNGYVTSHIVMGLAEIGYADLAEEAALYDIQIQAPDGQWGNGRYWGYFGEIAITWGRVWELTRDTEFLKKIFPSLMRGARRMEEVIKSDPWGVLPPISLDDDEMLQQTRFTGQNIRTLQGLLYGMEMARALGAKEDLDYLTNVYTKLREAFEKAMAEQTKKTGGYITPAMDVTTIGNDWDNLQLLHPVRLYEAFDPRIDATIAHTRKRYREGILPYLVPYVTGENEKGEPVFNTRNSLHYWQSFNNSFSALVRGGTQDQIDAVNDLYAMLLHTTSTHAPQEYGTLPWGTRDFSIPSNITPMMATSARLVSLLRAMLVREGDGNLYLLSAMSPAWLAAGKETKATELLTNFGKTSMEVKADATGWTINLANDFRNPPKELILRVPWFLDLQAIEVDGKKVEVPVAADNRPREIRLPLDARLVRFSGSMKAGAAEAFNYEALVRQYKDAYAKAYREYLKTGNVELRPDSESGFGLKQP